MIKKYGIIFLTSIFSFIIYSCGGEEEGSGTNTTLGPATNEPTLTIEHEAELTFKLNVYNFPDAKYFSFYIDYDMSKLTYSSYTSAIGNPVIFIVDSIGVQFAFIPNKSLAGDGNALEVLKLTFTGGDYKDTKILIKDFSAYDQNNTLLEGLNIGSICYLDTGIKIQAEENTKEPMQNWTPTGEYIWNSQWCGYIN